MYVLETLQQHRHTYGDSMFVVAIEQADVFL